MGLDMYLNKRIYIGAEYQHRKVKLKIECEVEGKPIDINPEKVSEIIERAGYWRKANAIHNWFVQNIQNGKDDCKEYHVEYEELMELKSLCMEALLKKDARKLQPVSGFFFGSTNVDDDYWQDITDTIEMLNGLKKDDGEYYYQSSW